MDEQPVSTPVERWLLLVHQLPAKPAYFRVKVWRRLQGLGAVAVKNAVYALPASDQAQEDFEWLLGEISQNGGEAFVCEARLIDGLTDSEVRTLFRRARDEDYEAIIGEARTLVEKLRGDPPTEQVGDAKAQLARLKARHAQVAGIDFFGANAGQAVEALLAELEATLREDNTMTTAPEPTSLGTLRGRTWVTRRDVYVDRIASAWLIRRCIDPEARFKFVPAKGYAPEAGELRFDMFAAEFTHEGERCTFEVLCERAGRDDPALRAIGEIVHDLDLKDGKFGRAETEGIGGLIAGLCLNTREDEERLVRGAALFEDLYHYFRKKRP